jgi:hypothetical protein
MVSFLFIALGCGAVALAAGLVPPILARRPKERQFEAECEPPDGGDSVSPHLPPSLAGLMRSPE